MDMELLLTCPFAFYRSAFNLEEFIRAEILNVDEVKTMVEVKTDEGSDWISHQRIKYLLTDYGMKIAYPCYKEPVIKEE